MLQQLCAQYITYLMCVLFPTMWPPCLVIAYAHKLYQYRYYISKIDTMSMVVTLRNIIVFCYTQYLLTPTFHTGYLLVDICAAYTTMDFFFTLAYNFGYKHRLLRHSNLQEVLQHPLYVFTESLLSFVCGMCIPFWLGGLFIDSWLYTFVILFTVINSHTFGSGCRWVLPQPGDRLYWFGPLKKSNIGFF